MDNPPKGTIHTAPARTPTAPATSRVKEFNAKYGAPGYKAVLTEFPASADQQRAQFIQRQQAKSRRLRRVHSDVIWTAEFASQKWLYDLSPYVSKSRDKYIPAPLETVHYGGKYWGVPETSDAAFLFYRTDKMKSAADDLAGCLPGGREAGRHRLPGRAVRGPDL